MTLQELETDDAAAGEFVEFLEEATRARRPHCPLKYAEDGRRVGWHDDGLHRLGDHGDVDVNVEAVDVADLGDDEVRKLARRSIYTVEFSNHPHDHPIVGPPP
jgi:hypothetical protein